MDLVPLQTALDFAFDGAAVELYRNPFLVAGRVAGIDARQVDHGPVWLSEPNNIGQ